MHLTVIRHALRGQGIKENAKRRNLFIAHDDHIEAGVVGRLVTRARAPSQTTSIVESLRFAVGSVNEMRVGGAKLSGEFVQGGPPDEHAGRRVEHAVFGVELFNRGPLRLPRFHALVGWKFLG